MLQSKSKGISENHISERVNSLQMIFLNTLIYFIIIVLYIIM